MNSKKRFSMVQSVDLSEQTPRGYLFLTFGIWNYVDRVEVREKDIAAYIDDVMVIRVPHDIPYLQISASLGQVITDEEATRQGAQRHRTQRDILKAFGMNEHGEKDPGQYL